MASPVNAGSAVAVPGHSDEETVGFIPAQGPKTAFLGGRVRRVALALGLAGAAAVVAVAFLLPSPDCKAQSGNADVGSAVGLVERRHAADERARAIVKVLNEKPKDEMNGVIEKAMKRAGEQALAKRRKTQDQAAFNRIIAELDDHCSIMRPDGPLDEGIYLSHDLISQVFMSRFETGPTQWEISLVNGAAAQDIYSVKNIVPATSGNNLVRQDGEVRVTGDAGAQRWRIRPATPGDNSAGLFTIQTVGAPTRFLTRSGQFDVTLEEKPTAAARWLIPCITDEYSRLEQRRATCAFNIIYATQYVARSSLMIQAAVRTCPNAKGLLSKICAVNALVVVASFSNLALSISNAASSCAESTNVKALCASAVEALVVSLTTIGAGGIVTAAACQPGLQASDLGLPAGATPANLGGPTYFGRRLFLGGGKANFLGQCILDFTQVAWSLGSVGIAITAAVRDSCPAGIQGTGILVGLSQSACSMDVAAVVYAFGRIALFIALATIHCTDELNLQALCAGGVSALVAAAAALVVTGDAFYIACDQGIKVVNSGGTVPLRIGAAAEAGATRRLASQALASGAENADLHKLAKDFGYNLSNPLKLPTFDNIDSAMKVLEAFDTRNAERFGVEEASLKKKFSSVEDMWRHVGFNITGPQDMPAAPAPTDESDRFVKLMEPVLTQQDKEKVAAYLATETAQKWQWLSSKSCP